jgi:hypothetical protein
MSSEIETQEILDYLTDQLKELENETNYFRNMLAARQDQIMQIKKILKILEIAKTKGLI